MTHDGRPYFENPCIDEIHEMEVVEVGHINDSYYLVLQCSDCGIEEEKFVGRSVYEYWDEKLKSDDVK